jgi:hypothetical protein
MEDTAESTRVSKERKKIAEEIESLFKKLYAGQSAYSIGQFHKEEFFLRTEYALVVLAKDNTIRISFSDRTKPSFAALISLLLEEIKGTDLIVCEDYATDEYGSMICDETNGSSTGVIVWDQKERYFTMLRDKVEHVVIRKTRKTKEGDV